MNVDHPQDAFVMLSEGRPMTDSRRIAKHFGRQHRSVLRAIRNMECSAEFAARNFVQCFEINELANGKKEPLYRITKDGFMFLAMGFTGKEAARIKEAYISAFNAMYDEISGAKQSLWQEMQALIAKEVESKVRASFGSHLMLKRKREIPGFRARHAELEDKIQQPLFIPEARH